MRLKSFLIVVTVMLLALTETLSAQTGRTFGARKLQLDDGTNTAAGQVFLSDVNGSLGVDLNGVPGLVNGFTFPSTCALLDLSSVTKGFLTPRMSNAQELGICAGTPPEGLIVYNLTNHTLDVFNGSAWGPVSGWQLRGNSISLGSTAIGGSYIGTNTAQDFVTATAGVERTRVVGIAGATQGFMGIGTASPNRLLEVAGIGGGVSSARFGSLGGVPLLAPPLVATDGFVMANNAGDISKYDGSVAVGAFAWLRTGNTILDANNKLGTINDVAINVTQNNATVMTVGTVAQGSNVGIKTAPLATWPLTVGLAGANSTLNLGNEQVNGQFTSAGNSTVGTTAGTTNTFGNGGAGTNNFIGNFALLNQVGNNAAANQFGNTATSNNFGIDATQNNIGNRSVAGVTNNNYGIAPGAGMTTNNAYGNAGAGGTANNIFGGTTGSITNTITGTTATAITLDVNSIANNLRLNNIAPGSNADAAFLDMTTIASGNVRTRTIGSMITGSEGVEVTYVGSSADAHFAPNNASVLFVTPRFVNTNGQSLSITGNSGGLGTTFASFNGSNDAIGLNNNASNNGTTTIGNTTAGANVQINSAGTGTSAVNTIALNGTTNINTTGTQSRTTVGNGVGAATQLLVNGAVGGLVGVAPFTNGPDNGWDMHVAGDQQITGTLKIGTASIVEEGVGNTITGYNPVGLTLNTGNSGGFGDLKFQGAGVLAATVKGTGALVGSIDLPQTIAAGPGVITMAGNRYIHSIGGVTNFFAGTNAGNFTLTGTSNTGVGNNALTALTIGAGNTGVGSGALLANTSGSFNTALGNGGALSANTTGAGNTAIGTNSLPANIIGSLNVAVGNGALFATTSDNNTAVGFNSGLSNTTGTNNTFLGNAANVSGGAFSNATAIGAGAIVAQSNSLVLGNTALPTSVGIGINAPTTILDVRGSTTVVGATNINSNNASTSLTNIGSLTNTSAVTVASNSAAGTGAIVLDVANVANSLRFNNIAVGANTDAAFLDISAVPSGQVRTRTIQSMVTGSNGVSVEYPGTSVADAHFADANNKSVFTTNRFINIDNQNLSFTGGGANTTFINLNGANNGVDINNTTVGNNNIGNGGGTTTNNIGQFANSNSVGINANSNNFGSASTSSTFGNSTTNVDLGNSTFAIAMTNRIGNTLAAGSTINNNIGQALAGTTVNNNIGSNTGTVTNTVLGATNINVTGGATTQIATTNAATTRIGVVGGSNVIAGTTTINDNVNATTGINTGTSTGAVSIGNATAGSGTVTVRSNNNAAGNSIVLDVTASATNNLALLNIANDAAPLSMLSLNAASQVRTTALSLMALEGVVYTGGAFRLGSTLTAGAGSNPFLVSRNINLDASNLNFTSNAGVLTPLQVIGGAVPQVNIQAAHNVNTGTYALTRIGNGSANHQLEVNGVVNAAIGDLLASPNWDLAVTGDIAASGIIKSGASIVIDGVSAIRRIVSDAPMTISTLGGDLTLAPASANTQITGNLITSSSITSLTGGIVAVVGNISATAGDLTAPAGNLVVGQNATANGAITATTGNITASAGNIIATNGKITAGGPANAPQSTLHSYGSLGANTAAGGSTTLTVANFFYRSTVPGAFVTLAAAASCPGRIYIVKNDPSFAALQITTVNSGGGLIDGAASINLTGPNTVMQFISDGTSWYVTSNN